MREYTLGDTVRLRARFLNDKGKPQDASLITCKIRVPGVASAVPVSCSVELGSTNLVVADYVPSVAGTFSYRFENPSAPRAAAQRYFKVNDDIVG